MTAYEKGIVERLQEGIDFRLDILKKISQLITENRFLLHDKEMLKADVARLEGSVLALRNIIENKNNKP